VAWVIGHRDTASFQRLWEKIQRPGCTYFTDDWDSYAEVIPPEQHVIGKAGTRLIESDNSNTRHRLARMTRRTKVVSKSERMIDLTMRLWTYFEDPVHFREYQQRVLYIFG
jgi:insertion element IS1 protein InsB